MDYTQFVKAELLVLIPVLVALGAVLKKAEKIKDNYIPFILSVVGVALSCLYVLGTEGVTAVSIFTAITQGILSAGGAVLGNQAVKQLSKS